MKSNFLGLVVLSVLLTIGHTSRATDCALEGKLCGSNGNPDCCEGSCPTEGPFKNHCVADVPVTTTSESTTTTSESTSTSSTSSTIHSVPSTTSTSTTSTSLPNHAISGPARFTMGDVGLRYQGSTSINYDPRDGTWANQYVEMARASYLHFIVVPEVLRAFRDIPSCTNTLGSGSPQSIQAMVGKFFILYSIRPLTSGDPYFFHPNYLWDLPQNLFRKLKGCIKDDPFNNARRPEVTDELLALLNLRIEAGMIVPGNTDYVPVPIVGGDRSHISAGLLDPRRPHPPLTAHQCALLDEAHSLHQQHAAALLAHDFALADELAPQVTVAQILFELSARDADEQTLFSLIFTGQIDPFQPQSQVDHLTQETIEFHHRWAEAFQCGGGTPKPVLIWRMNLGHARAHFLRAVAGYKLREVCESYIGNCLVTPN